MASVVVARIVIERSLSDDGDLIDVQATDELDEDLALVDGLGLLRFAEDTLIRRFMGEEDDE
jgi:hypothetical protein